jgi:hypothetical protein
MRYVTVKPLTKGGSESEPLAHGDRGLGPGGEVLRANTGTVTAHLSHPLHHGMYTDTERCTVVIRQTKTTFCSQLQVVSNNYVLSPEPRLASPAPGPVSIIHHAT